MNFCSAFPNRIPGKIFAVAIQVWRHLCIHLLAIGCYKIFKSINLIVIGVEYKTNKIIIAKTIASIHFSRNAVAGSFMAIAAEVNAFIVVQHVNFSSQFRIFFFKRCGTKFGITQCSRCIFPCSVIQYAINLNG